MENESVLGLTIGDRSVQAVEVTRTGTTATVTAIDDWENTLLGTGQEARIDGAKQFTDTLGAFLKANRIKSFTASVSLDTSLMVLHTFPADEGTDRADLLKAFTWELQQLRPDAGANLAACGLELARLKTVLYTTGFKHNPSALGSEGLGFTED